ncbi:cation-translocating P-type ATPase [Candidatus Bipolaricaulota bacterium]|nr:cation-translocating P-type ATPase [Candidatus Bipolaricaulota bacterium]
MPGLRDPGERHSKWRRKKAGFRGVWASPRAVKTWTGGGLLLAGLLLKYGLTGFNRAIFTWQGTDFLVSDLTFLLGIAVAGNVIVRNGFRALRKLNLSIDLLMTSAIFGSVIASVFGGKHIFLEGATLAVLYNFAELLEDYSIEKARGSLRELKDLSPDTAVVRRGEVEQEIPAEAVNVGDRVLIRPGSRVPVDGRIVEGGSSINESPITGESIPADKGKGDEVFAGTINQQGYLEVEARSSASESTISRIVKLVESAERKKTKHEKFVNKFSAYYTPAVVVAAVAIAAIPPVVLSEPWAGWFVRGITMLVLACPCAFVISTPVSVVSGITSAAKNGVLIESGTTLEAMSEVQVAAFDKTGTLTRGELTITDVIPLNGKREEEVIKCACGVEERSDHPIAEAIVTHVHEEHDISHDHGIEGFEEISGKGITASLKGERHYAGKPSLIEEMGFDLSHVHHSSDNHEVNREASKLCRKGDCLNLTDVTIPRLQKEGKTVILVTNETELEGIIAVADGIRSSTKRAIEELNSAGIRTVMLTGDNEHTARAIAEKISIEDFRAELMPGEKVEAVEDLSEKYGAVAMVGDGINDAPALAAADVGIAMGAAGTDTALETADIALIKDDLSKLPYLHRLSSKTKQVIRQNIFASLGVKAILAIGVPLGYVTIALAVLLGDAGMTVGVTTNAMRISGLRVDSDASILQ